MGSARITTSGCSVPTFASNCLEGKSILITGGLGAIGRVVVGRLLAHSARVAVNDILSEEKAQKIIHDEDWNVERLAYFKADVTILTDVQKLVAEVVKTYGRLDAALCHAGMAFACPIAEYSETDWDKIINVNLKSAFLVAQAAARAMIEQGTKGKIVFTSSWVQDVPWPDITPYNVTKSAMKMLMRGMARELAIHGIRVNSVAPGILAIGMSKPDAHISPARHRRGEKAIPLGHRQPPETVADAMIYLLSEAGDYITGATLLVDGGASLYPMD